MATTGQAPTTPIVQAARRLHQEAKGHTKLANQHRQRAKTLHKDVDQMREQLKAMGIDLVLDDE